MKIKTTPHPFLFLIGYRLLSAPREYAEELLNLCSAQNIAIISSETDGEDFYLICAFFPSIRLLKLSRRREIPLRVLSSRGIPSLILRYKSRYGAALGLLVSVALIFLGGSVVWDIRIDGERSLSESEVREVLSECGLSLGTRRRSLDIDALENRVLILSDDISWISVNIIGTVAEVEIREVDLPEEPQGSGYAASNIVAAESGRIVGFENIKGNISVEIGDVVSEGQLLLGGIYGDEESGFRYTAAKGRVLAEVEREFVVEIPRAEERKVYKEATKSEKYLIFFKKRIKFFSNYRNLPTTCDKIDMEEFLPAPNGKELPVGIYTASYREYEYQTVSLTDEEMLALAQTRLDTLLRASLEDAELLSKTVSTEIGEDSLVLRCRVRCIANIAEEQEIKIDGLP